MTGIAAAGTRWITSRMTHARTMQQEMKTTKSNYTLSFSLSLHFLYRGVIRIVLVFGCKSASVSKGQLTERHHGHAYDFAVAGVEVGHDADVKVEAVEVGVKVGHHHGHLRGIAVLFVRHAAVQDRHPEKKQIQEMV